jgi:acetyltransferase-like isoleucine patch superfamily enzyme
MSINNLLYRIYYRLISIFIYKWQFKVFGISSKIISPLKIDGKKNIEIGEHVSISYRTWLACLSLTGEKKPVLHIGNHSTIGNFNHIYATKSIIIEDYVLTADKVYITDNLHGYENIQNPIMQQPIKQINPVIIGTGTWLGENVCVLGAKIGKHCVIGANAVVTKDIPDYSVAAGIPAKVIKRYDFEKKEWQKIQ